MARQKATTVPLAQLTRRAAAGHPPGRDPGIHERGPLREGRPFGFRQATPAFCFPYAEIAAAVEGDQSNGGACLADKR
jgi:hypothetical protein